MRSDFQLREFERHYRGGTSLVNETSSVSISVFDLEAALRAGFVRSGGYSWGVCSLKPEIGILRAVLDPGNYASMGAATVVDANQWNSFDGLLSHDTGFERLAWEELNADFAKESRHPLSFNIGDFVPRCASLLRSELFQSVYPFFKAVGGRYLSCFSASSLFSPSLLWQLQMALATHRTALLSPSSIYSHVFR